jgi:hypothetical protein
MKRTKEAFDEASILNIKSSLFLLRHMMIDNLKNQQNYPNLVPRLNILQAFIDTNIANR